MKAKLKQGESVFRCNSPMVALKWCDKRAATVIYAIHEATNVVTKRKHTRENVNKPEVIFSYTNLMSRASLSDQYLASYSFFEK